MVKLSIDKSKIHAMAHTTKQQLDKRDIKRPNNKPVSFNTCLQIVSQSLFSKPYEEVISTYLDETPQNPNTEDLCLVVVLSYGSEKVIACKGEYYVASCNGTDMQISDDEIMNQAERLAATLKTEVKTYPLPKCLKPGWEYEDIIALAKRMGVFDHALTIFEMIEDGDNQIFLNGTSLPYSLDGDWEAEIENITEAQAEDDEEFEDPFDQIIWSPELTNDSLEKFEYYFTFKDFCNAKPVESHDGKQWIINDDHKTYTLAFYS